MKYQHDEEHLESEPIDPVELADIAAAMRALWHAMMRGVEQPAALRTLQRQQFWVLSGLAAGPRRMTDLATCSQTSQASLTGIVDRLEEQGLVVRHRSDGDRRVVEVAATDEGLRVLNQVNEVFLGRLQELAAPLSERERKEFLRLLHKLLLSKRYCA